MHLFVKLFWKFIILPVRRPVCCYQGDSYPLCFGCVNKPPNETIDKKNTRAKYSYLSSRSSLPFHLNVFWSRWMQMFCLSWQIIQLLFAGGRVFVHRAHHFTILQRCWIGFKSEHILGRVRDFTFCSLAHESEAVFIFCCWVLASLCKHARTVLTVSAKNDAQFIYFSYKYKIVTCNCSDIIRDVFGY